MDHARLGFNISAFVRLRAKPSHKRSLGETARAIPQVIEMHSVTGDDCMVADSSTSVLLETIIPLRNPIPTQQAAATNKRARVRERVRA
jgi:DNA-binding Lrp family transcriptional regulator